MRVLITERQLNSLVKEINLGRWIKGLVKKPMKFSSPNTLKMGKINKLVGNSSDSLLKKFGQPQLNNIENVLKKLGDAKTIKSARGGEFPISQLKYVLDSVANGSKTIDDVKKFLPEKLADGTPFREVFVQNLSKKTTTQNIVKEIPIHIQNIGKLSDSLRSKYGEGAKKIEDLLLYAINTSSEQNGKFIKSMDGQLVPTNSITSIIDGLSKGSLKSDEVLKYLPEKLTNGTSFKSRIEKFFPSNKQIKNIRKVDFDDIVNQFRFPNCRQGACPEINSLVNQMVSKVPNVKFQPSKVKVNQQSVQNFIGRDGQPTLRNVIEVEMENGQKIIMYSSSGSNVGTTGKKFGEWFAIPGWGADGMYLKTDPSNALTKGGNQYLTNLAKFLETYGPESLG